MNKLRQAMSPLLPEGLVPRLFCPKLRLGLTLLIVAIFVSQWGYPQSLDDYLRIARENNPSLEAAYQEYLAGQERPAQVTLANPELGGGYFFHPMETRLGSQRARLSVSQTLPWFGSLKAERAVGQQRARIQEYQWRNRQLDILYQVQQTYYQLYEIDKTIDILRQSLKLLQTYERLATQQYENGLARMVDILQSQMKIRESQARLEIRQQEATPLIVRFNSLLNREPAGEVVLPDTLVIPSEPTDIAYPTDSVWGHYPQYQAVLAEQSVLQNEGEIARLRGKPTFGVGLEYMLITPRTDAEVPDNGRDGLMSTATISLPLWRKKYAAARQEVLLRQQATRATAEQVATELTTEWSQAYQQQQTALKEVALYQAQTEQTQQALRILESAYSTEGQDFADILDFQQQLLDYRIRLISATVRYHTAQAQLDKLTTTY